MCCKNQNNIDFSSRLQQLLLLPHISDPYLIQRAQPLHGYNDDPCSWGGESWSFCSNVVSRDRQQCGKENGRREDGGKGGEEGHRGTHQKQQRARPDWGDQPFLLLPSRALGQLSNQVTSLSRVASGQLFSSLSLFSLSLSPLLSVPQPAAVAADVIFDRILSVPACWLLPPCLNKCKHRESSFKQVHIANMRIFHVGQTERRRSDCSSAFMQTG